MLTPQQASAFGIAIINGVTQDDQPIDKMAERLFTDYQNSNSQVRAVIDNVFITITGYAVSTLMSKSGITPPPIEDAS